MDHWYNRLLKQYRSEAETSREKFLKLRIEAAPELQQAMYDMEDTLNRLDVSTPSIARAYDNALTDRRDMQKAIVRETFCGTIRRHTASSPIFIKTVVGMQAICTQIRQVK